jgi:ClpP class serine protease
VHIEKLGSRKASPNPFEPIDEESKQKMTNYVRLKSEDLIERLFQSRQKKIEAAGLDFTSFRQQIQKSSHFRGEDLMKLGLVDGLGTYQDSKRENHVEAKDLHLWVPYQSDPFFRGTHSQGDLEGILATRFQTEH